MSTVTEDQVASDRDLHAARLSRAGWTYGRITEYLGYPDRRAAHRGVLRGLAEPAEDDAQLRALRAWETDERLLDVQRRLWHLMERHQPYTGETAADARAFFRIIDALLAVLVRRCQLRGLFTHPYRYDTWWRRDVPFDVWAQLHLQANRLEREARIPVRWRAPKRAPQEANQVNADHGEAPPFAVLQVHPPSNTGFGGRLEGT
jgi:hypothetical protein